MTPHFNTYQERERSALPKVLLSGGIAFGLGVAFTVGYIAWQGQQQRMTEMTAVIEELMEQNKASAQQAVVAAQQPVPQPTPQVAAPQVALVQAPESQAPQAPAPQAVVQPEAVVQPQAETQPQAVVQQVATPVSYTHLTMPTTPYV